MLVASIENQQKEPSGFDRSLIHRIPIRQLCLLILKSNQLPLTILSLPFRQFENHLFLMFDLQPHHRE
ncbi:MAG: hypothetical protein ACI8QH_000806 [Flammeovirgaceae bacterium]|jgi:hypothetical protein